MAKLNITKEMITIMQGIKKPLIKPILRSRSLLKITLLNNSSVWVAGIASEIT